MSCFDNSPLQKVPKGSSLVYHSILKMGSAVDPGSLVFQWYATQQRNTGFRRICICLKNKDMYILPGFMGDTILSEELPHQWGNQCIIMLRTSSSMYCTQLDELTEEGYPPHMA